jgi:hypothetical protein
MALMSHSYHGRFFNVNTYLRISSKTRTERDLGSSLLLLSALSQWMDSGAKITKERIREKLLALLNEFIPFTLRKNKDQMNSTEDPRQYS